MPAFLARFLGSAAFVWLRRNWAVVALAGALAYVGAHWAGLEAKAWLANRRADNAESELAAWKSAATNLGEALTRERATIERVTVLAEQLDEDVSALIRQSELARIEAAEQIREIYDAIPLDDECSRARVPADLLERLRQQATEDH